MTDGPLAAATWQKVNDIFHRALDMPEHGRRVWLDDACGTSGVLRAEVDSLLAAHARLGDFIEQPATNALREERVITGPAGQLAGRTIGAYRVLSLLGAGGMGEVYLAEDTRLARQVALKVLSPAFTEDSARRERLRREARIAAAMTDPGIASVYALEEIDGQLVVASEYVLGRTLREEFDGGPFAAAAVLDMARDVGHALVAAHGRGIVHRDLKPENLIRAETGRVKILDFGIARSRITDGPMPLTLEGAAIGTPAYMAPEQIRGDPVDGRADLFALGVVLYEAFTGANPFASGDPASTLARVLELVPRSFADHGEAIDASERAVLDRIVQRCLRKAPEDRYQTALDLVAATETPLLEHPTAARMSRTTHVAGRAGWWWQFHQAGASAVYSALLIPLWIGHEWLARPAGLLLFLVAFCAAVGATTLRLHSWFAYREYFDEWRAQRSRVSGWLRTADWTFAGVLAVEGVATMSIHASMTVLLVGAAVTVVLSAIVIEPATTRAAFGHEASRR